MGGHQVYDPTPWSMSLLSVSFLKVLRLLIKLYESVPNPDWVNICQCLMFLDDSQEVAKILHTLIEGTEVRHQSSQTAWTVQLHAALPSTVVRLTQEESTNSTLQRLHCLCCIWAFVTNIIVCHCVAGRGPSGLSSVL